MYSSLYITLSLDLSLKSLTSTQLVGDNLLVDPTVNTTGKDGAETTSKSKYHHTASQILEGLGGSENITTLTNCATRLRMELKDNSIIDEQKLEMQER